MKRLIPFIFAVTMLLIPIAPVPALATTFTGSVTAASGAKSLVTAFSVASNVTQSSPISYTINSYSGSCGVELDGASGMQIPAGSTAMSSSGVAGGAYVGGSYAFASGSGFSFYVVGVGGSCTMNVTLTYN